jgi:hypothetical protein
VITYRVTLDVPLQLVIKVSNLLRKRRKELGTRNGTRALTCYQQAVFILAWFRDRPGLSRLGQGFGISQATAYRYKDEGVEVLRALAPTLHDTLEKVDEQGLPYLILDGTLIASDRCSDKKTSKKGTEIDKWYSGKAHHHAGLVQALTGPSGIPHSRPRRATAWSMPVAVSGPRLSTRSHSWGRHACGCRARARR